MNRHRKMLRPIAAILALPLAACGTSSAEEPAAIDTAVVERGNLRITAEATGTVEPIRRVEVKSKAGGEILQLSIDVGDEVEPGTLLATIDPRDVRNRHDQAQADLDVAEARAEIADAQLSRQQQLRESGVITDQELEGAKLEQSNAHANLIKARTALELAELQLTDVTIRAPMKGTIIQKDVEQGQVIQSASGNVSGGTTLFIMANLDEMQVRTLVDETDMGEIQPGMATRVQVEAFPDRVFEGHVEKVEPQAVVEQNVTMFPVIVRLDNQSGLLRPGMNAEVEVLIDEVNEALLVPNSAIVMPQDAAPAAMALGLDPNDMDMPGLRNTEMFAGRMPAGAGGERTAGGQRGAGAQRGTAGEQGAGAERGTGPEGAGSGEAQANGRATRGQTAGSGESGQASGSASAERQTRRAVVFAVDSAGQLAPKVVEIGLNDWDFTQVVSGLSEGEQLAVIGAAQLQAQQQEMLDRIRSRRGGGPF